MLRTGLLAPADAPLEEQQQRLNDAHVHFEHMMGSADCPSEFFKSASAELRALVQEYNLRLHALEDDLRQQERRLQVGARDDVWGASWDRAFFC